MEKGIIDTFFIVMFFVCCFIGLCALVGQKINEHQEEKREKEREKEKEKERELRRNYANPPRLNLSAEQAGNLTDKKIEGIFQIIDFRKDIILGYVDMQIQRKINRGESIAYVNIKSIIEFLKEFHYCCIEPNEGNYAYIANIVSKHYLNLGYKIFLREDNPTFEDLWISWDKYKEEGK